MNYMHRNRQQHLCALTIFMGKSYTYVLKFELGKSVVYVSQLCTHCVGVILCLYIEQSKHEYNANHLTLFHIRHENDYSYTHLYRAKILTINYTRKTVQIYIIYRIKLKYSNRISSTKKDYYDSGK